MKNADLAVKPETVSVTSEVRSPRRPKSWMILGVTTCFLASAGGTGPYVHL